MRGDQVKCASGEGLVLGGMAPPGSPPANGLPGADAERWVMSQTSVESLFGSLRFSGGSSAERTGVRLGDRGERVQLRGGEGTQAHPGRAESLDRELH